MKVFVVEGLVVGRGWSGWDFLGVAATEDKAQVIRTMNRHHLDFRVTEHEVAGAEDRPKGVQAEGREGGEAKRAPAASRVRECAGA